MSLQKVLKPAISVAVGFCAILLVRRIAFNVERDYLELSETTARGYIGIVLAWIFLAYFFGGMIAAAGDRSRWVLLASICGLFAVLFYCATSDWHRMVFLVHGPAALFALLGGWMMREKPKKAKADSDEQEQ